MKGLVGCMVVDISFSEYGMRNNTYTRRSTDSEGNVSWIIPRKEGVGV